jgi:hypothetical protein
MTNYVSLTWKEFEEQFKPIKNHLVPDPNQQMFETYGEEVEFVISQVVDRKVWTYSDGEMCSFVSNGYHYINRIGYYVCEVPYDEDTEYEIITSTEEECECYSEDEEILQQRNDEWGDPECEKCEGYGYVTKYND